MRMPSTWLAIPNDIYTRILFIQIITYHVLDERLRKLRDVQPQQTFKYMIFIIFFQCIKFVKKHTIYYFDCRQMRP